ncbi:MAG TPA: c-type cytochrome [Sediminibacterium sp.]|jgi:hypothetical protein
MYKKIFTLSVIAIAGAVVFVACSNAPGRSKAITPVLDSAALVARGEYLVNTTGCDDCHSPKKMGPNGPELISGLRFSGFQHGNTLPKVNVDEIKKGFTMFAPDFTATVGMWGVSYAANITSDATGIGNWTEENFLRAIRHGKLKGIENSRPLLPPMPWTVYRNMTDTDLRAIFAYLKTTQPVENVVPGPKALSEL